MNDLVQRLLVGLLSTSLMLSVGMRLEIAQLRAALSDKPFVAKTVAFNFLVFPLIAWGTSSVFGLSESVRVGLMLCAVGAGGCNSLIFIGKVDGDLSYGFSSILITGALSTLLLPWLIASATSGGEAGAYVRIVTASVKAIVLFQVLPTVAGYLAKSFPKIGSAAVAKVLSKIAEICLWVLTLLFAAVKGRNFGLLGSAALIAVAVVVVVGLVASLIVVPPFSPTGKAFVFSGLVRNIVVALLLNEWIVKSEQAKTTILCYCFFMLVAGGLATFAYRKSEARSVIAERVRT
jgi:predicted Na+-dependent transporter